ncbi:MAG: putative oxidoreductase YvaA [Firmicutes bacterium ADurb.BinA052]|nr:MAG: putative oxidoreductase YvaA [Firmicutes bacterium ADurb.BinA052]
MPRTRVCLVGCGTAAERYYIPALTKLATLWDEVVFVDTDLARAERLAAAFPRANAAQDYRTLIGTVQGAILVVPHALHHPLSKEFLEAGAHVLCEKPLAETSGQADEMIAAAAAGGVTLSVNNTRRMFPSFREVKRLIAEGAIGRPSSLTYYEGNSFAWPSATPFYVDPRATSKGVLLDVGAHVLDTVCWWLGGKPELRECRDDSFGGPESVTRVRAALNACEVEVFLSRLYELCNRYRVEGDEGVIAGDIFRWDAVTLTPRGGTPRKIALSGSVRAYPEFVTPILGNFLKVVRGETPPEIPAAAVRDSVALIEECYAARRRFPMPWCENLEV